MTLTIVTESKTITVPKRVRDNMRLQPFDWIEFSSDDYSILINRLVRDQPGDAKKVAEPAVEYDSSRTAVQISSHAEVIIPEQVYEELLIETGSIVGLFRDVDGYRLVPIYNPTQPGKPTGAVVDGGIEQPDNAIMEYSVQVTKEFRRERGHEWENIVRFGAGDPFVDVDEPESDDVLLDSITNNDPAFHR